MGTHDLVAPPQFICLFHCTTLGNEWTQCMSNMLPRNSPEETLLRQQGEKLLQFIQLFLANAQHAPSADHHGDEQLICINLLHPSLLVIHCFMKKLPQHSLCSQSQKPGSESLCGQREVTPWDGHNPRQVLSGLTQNLSWTLMSLGPVCVT